MSTYTILADVNEQAFQNPQELAAIWGDVRNDIERLGGKLLASYALVGGHDYQITFEVEEEDDAIRISMAVERHGLDTQTMRAIPVDRLGELIEDI